MNLVFGRGSTKLFLRSHHRVIDGGSRLLGVTEVALFVETIHKNEACMCKLKSLMPEFRWCECHKGEVNDEIRLLQNIRQSRRPSMVSWRQEEGPS